MTGYWKTDRNFTLGLFHFISPADVYTYTKTVQELIIVVRESIQRSIVMCKMSA